MKALYGGSDIATSLPVVEDEAHPVAHAQPVHRLQAVPPVARLVSAARQDPCRRFMRDFGSHCPGHGSASCASTGRVDCRCKMFRCGRQRCSHGSFSMMGLAKSRSTCTHVSNSVHAPQCYTRHARSTAPSNLDRSACPLPDSASSAVTDTKLTQASSIANVNRKL